MHGQVYIIPISIPFVYQWHYNMDDNTNTNGRNPCDKYVLRPATPNYDNNELHDILKSMDLDNIDYIYHRCKECYITVASLKVLKNEHFIEIIPHPFVGTRALFKDKLVKWQNEQQHVFEPDINNRLLVNKDTTISAVPNILKSTPNQSLSNILQNNEGQQIKESYRVNKRLSDSNRKKLIKMIVMYFINNSIKMTPDIMDDISNQIVLHFTSECKESYFQRIKNKPHSGKLHWKYHNTLREQTIKCNSSTEITDEIKTPEVEVNAADIHQWLKHNREPFPLILEKWKETVIFRQTFFKKHIEDLNTSDIIKNWPLYSHPEGHLLIDIDFDYQYPNATKLFIKWDHFVDKIRTLFLDIKDADTIQYWKSFNTCKEIPNEDEVNISIMYCIHAVIRPSTFKSLGNTRKKHTIIDSRSAFYKIFDTVSKINDFLKTITAPTQPFIFLIADDLSNIKEYYVYFDTIMYKVHTFLKTIDLCFKIYMVFNLKYPPECHNIWLFIQHYFFQIKTKSDINNANIKSIITYLNS